MAGRIRGYDWAATPLGPIEIWPQALRTAIEIVLASPLVSTLVCGPNRLLIYNDAAARLYGARHPAALGRPVPETFPEGWRTVAPLYERVFAGESVQISAQPLDTRGEGETASDIFDAVLIPLRDEQGHVAYAHMTGFEVSGRLRAEAALRENEERQAFLLRLSDAIRTLAEPVEVQTVALRLLAEHLGLSRAAYSEIDDDHDRARRVATYDDALPPVARDVRISDFSADQLACYLEGRTFIVTDTETDPRVEATRDACRAIQVRAWVGVPLVKGGRLLVVLGVEKATPYAWTDAEVRLLEEAAERTWAASERARAEAALRISEAKYRTLFDTMGQGYCELELIRDAEGRAVDQCYLELNPALERLFGIPAAEAKGRKASEFFPELEPIWHEAFDHVAKTGMPERIEHQIASLDRWFEVFAYPRGDDRLTVLYEEVTERKRAELALRESEERQRFLLALGDAMRHQSHASGKIEVAARHLGERLNASRVLYAEYDWARNVADIFNGWFADVAQPFPTIMQLENYEGEALNDLRAGRTVRIDNIGLLEKEPAYAAIAAVGVQALLSVPLIVDGRLAVNVSIHQREPRQWTDDEVTLVQEVAERLWAEVVRARAETARRESEEKFRRLFETMNEGFAVMEAVRDDAGRVVDMIFLQANQAWERQAGVVFVPGTKASEFFVGSVSQEWIETWSHVADTGEAHREEQYVASTDRWYETHYWQVGGTGSDMLAAVFDDITARKRAEAALCESEEQHAFLLALSDEIGSLTASSEIMAVATARLCEHLHANRVFYGEIAGDLLTVEQDYTSDVPSIVGEHSLKPFGSEFIAAYQPGAVIRVDDIERDPKLTDAGRAALRDRQVAAFADAVLFAEMTGEVSMLAVQSATPRVWSASEEGLIREVAERVKSGIKRTRAEEALRETSKRLADLVEGVPVAIGLTNAQGEVILANEAWRAMVPKVIPSRDPERLLLWRAWGPDGRPLDKSAFPGARALRGEAVLPGIEMLYGNEREARWKQVSSVPLRNEDGDVTGTVAAVADIDALKRSEAALRESEERFRQFADASTDVLWIRGAQAMTMEYLNPAFERVYGYPREEILEEGPGEWGRLIHPDDRAAALSALERVREGKQITHEFRLLHPDGQVRWIENTDFPLFDAQGRVQRIGGFAKDVTEKKETTERMKVLVAELQHRTRNLLGVVRSISDRTLASSSSLDEFQERFRDRIGALTRVNSLLSRLEESTRITFDELLQAELAGHGVLDSDGHESQVALEGPKGIRLRSSMAQTFALGLHELATNALKYGALSRPEGQLLVRWGLVDGESGERRLRVDWQESGVPVPPPARGQPYRRGSGRELIERALPYQLGAETSYELTPDGVRCTITLPISTTHREVSHA